jgi:hypothetical protein
MSNEDIIKAIEKHQKCPYLHPLTCGKDSRHQVLVAVEENGKVVLKCPDCDYVQPGVPSCVMEIAPYVDEIEKENARLFGQNPSNQT